MEHETGSHDIVIRGPRAEDEPSWRELWRAYCDFYGASVREQVTAATWRRMLDPTSQTYGQMAERGGVVVGFSTYVLHEATWTLGLSCYLEDLYVDPAARGMGVGRALIDDLMALGRMRGWSTLYWQTHINNTTARRLYDTYRQADDFVRYRLYLD